MIPTGWHLSFQWSLPRASIICRVSGLERYWGWVGEERIIQIQLNLRAPPKQPFHSSGEPGTSGWTPDSGGHEIEATLLFSQSGSLRPWERRSPRPGSHCVSIHHRSRPRTHKRKSQECLSQRRRSTLASRMVLRVFPRNLPVIWSLLKPISSFPRTPAGLGGAREPLRSTPRATSQSLRLRGGG